MDKITLNDFLASMKVCEVSSSVSSKCHKYTPMEDAVAFYFSRFDVKCKDKLDIAVLKLNQLLNQPNPLTKSSFGSRIQNMDFSVTKGATGLKNNSIQGKVVADQIDKMMRTQKLDRFHLRDLLNEFLGTKAL